MIRLSAGVDAPADLLRVSSCPVSTEYLVAARRLAQARGRIIERDGLLIASLGTAVTICFPQGVSGNAQYVTDLLAQLAARSHEPQRSPIALGALSFDLTQPDELVIPEIAVIASSDRPPYRVLVGAAGDLELLERRDLLEEARALDGVDTPEPPDQFTLAAAIAHTAFKDKVAAAVATIATGALDKVVLAREVVITANRPFFQGDLFSRLRVLHPSCFAFALGGFIGASPELLVRKQDNRVECMPLAGTIARSGDPEEDARLATELMHSDKDRAEHQFVVQAICAALEPWIESLNGPPAPHILELRNVVHLSTQITATLKDRLTTSLTLVDLLHPTPAVCGTPAAAARAYIEEHEGFPRDHYAGVVGYTDRSGNGEWWLGIRSAIVDGATARIFAGVGIVAGSEPAEELAETQLKLQAMLAVLVRP